MILIYFWKKLFLFIILLSFIEIVQL